MKTSGAMQNHNSTSSRKLNLSLTVAFVGLIVAFVSSIVSYRQLSTMKDQLLETQNSRRAWLLVGEIQYFDSGILVKFVNSGSTPAINVHGFVTDADVLAEIPAVDEEPRVGQPGFRIGVPRAVVAKDGFANARLPIALDKLDKIKSGNFKRKIYGTFWYCDVFKRKHWTQFCFITAKEGENLSCPTHNDVDKD